MTHAPTVILSRTAAALAGFSKRAEIPTTLGSVTLIKPLGEGGMSVVHLARHDILQKNVAVKFLLDIPASPDDPRFTSFIEGARAAAAIRHHGLNIVYHADSISGIPYLVMELIEGPNLSELLTRHGRYPLNIARAIIESVCESVGELHNHGIIHRDIKPANVMIDPTGRVVVTDFGLAMQRPAALFGGSVGGVAGTPVYMAPEMFEGNVSTRTDVYALGVMIFELLTGKPPFTGEFQDLRLAHRTAPLPVAPLAASAVPESIIVLIERALHKDALYRPKSARHILDAFVKACDAAGIPKATPAQIQRFIEIGRAGDHPSASSTSSTPTPAYYDRLNTLADIKRRTPDGTIMNAPSDTDDPPSTPVAHVESPSVVADLAPAAPPPHPAAEVPAAHTPAPRPALLTRLATPAFTIPAFSLLSAATIALAFQTQLWIGTFAAITLAAAAAVFTWCLYTSCVLARPRCTGATHCGWCGSSLSNLRDLRCPECGRLVGSPRAKGDTPVAARFATRCRNLSIALGAFLVLAAAWAPPCLRWMHFDTARPGSAFTALLLALLPAAAAGVLALHFGARRSACLTGKTYCGRCGANLEGCTQPQCAACGARV